MELPIPCKCCAVKAVRIRHGQAKGRYGWARVMGDTLERSTETFAKPEQAFDAAHAHYRLVIQ